MALKTKASAAAACHPWPVICGSVSQEGVGSPFTARFCWALGRDKRLDLHAMREAAVLLTGEVLYFGKSNHAYKLLRG